MAIDGAFNSVVADLASAIENRNSRAFTEASGMLMVQAHTPGNKAARTLYSAAREATAWERSEMLAMQQVLTNRGLAKFEK